MPKITLFLFLWLARCVCCFVGTQKRESAQCSITTQKIYVPFSFLSAAKLQPVTPREWKELAKLGLGGSKKKKKRSCSQDFIKYWKDESHYILPQPEETLRWNKNSAELLCRYVISTKDQSFMCEDSVCQGGGAETHTHNKMCTLQ